MAVRASAVITLSTIRDIQSVTWFYLLQPSTAAAPAKPTTLTPPTITTTGYSGWTDVEPSYSVGDTKALYFTERTIYTDGTFEYTTPSCSSGYEAAKQAYNKAVDAEKKATNYMSSDATGIMVANLAGSSEQPSTATTRNVFIDNDSVDIRNGQSVLASFGETAVIGPVAIGSSRTEISSNGIAFIRKTSSTAETILANIGYGIGQSQSGSDGTAPFYTFGTRAINAPVEATSLNPGNISIAEGHAVIAQGFASHAEGVYTEAVGQGSHAEGDNTYATGSSSHAEGSGTYARGPQAHTEGLETEASGRNSHAQNSHTVAASDCQTALGKYNIADQDDEYALIIGNGTGYSARSNAFTVDWDGNPVGRGMAGMIQMYAGSTAPAGWLLCQGQAVSRTTYAALFAVIGTTYGAGNGSTTFNLPDMRDRMPIGAGNLYSLNAAGGNKDAIIPYHNHSIAAQSISGGSHSHTYEYKGDAASTLSGSNPDSTGNVVRRKDPTEKTGLSTAAATHTHTLAAHNTNYAGTSGNVTDANLPPYRGISFIICTGKTS